MFGLAPWRNKDADTVKTEIEQLFDCFFRDFSLGNVSLAALWVPNVDMYQTSDAVVVQLDLPGVDAEDLDITLRGAVLVIQGEKRREALDSCEDFHRTECPCGSFRRIISLPCRVDPDQVSASYRRGVLRIVLPRFRRIEGTRRTIRVQ